jgi:Cation transporter/ATPase, N-terminus
MIGLASCGHLHAPSSKTIALKRPQTRIIGAGVAALMQIKTATLVIDLEAEATATSDQSELTGLSSVEAVRWRAEFGPNAVVEGHVHPLVRVARHFWSPAPGRWRPKVFC